MFDDTIFGIEGVTTKLTNFSDGKDIIGIKVEALGLSENAVNYKPLLLSFVCSNEFLRSELSSGKVINFYMSAPDREAGRHVNMRIKLERCGS